MIPEKVTNIMAHLISQGYKAYIIGGAVRDTILGIEPHDWDVFTDCADLLTLFPDGKVMGGDERQSKILTVIVDGIEVSQYRKNGDRTEVGIDLKTHCSTCDFTINAMAMDINGKIIDYYNGKEDLHKGFIKCVGSPKNRFEEDKLRIMRAVRFACKYEFQLWDLGDYINEADISDLPVERVREEFMKILQYDTAINVMDNNGLLDKIIPEYYHENHFLDGGDHHDESPICHMHNAFSESCKITDNVLLRLACFLHDIGKGTTRTEDEPSSFIEGGTTMVEVKKDNIHFYEHEKVGADMTEAIMERLKFSKEDVRYVRRLVKSHMYSYKDKPSKKSYTKFFQKLEDDGITIEDYVMLIYCDHQGNMKKPRIKFGDFLKNNWLHKMYYEIKFSEEPMRIIDLKVGGQDVMGVIGLEPSPKIGEILKEMFNQVMDGKVKNNRAELLNLLNNYEDTE